MAHTPSVLATPRSKYMSLDSTTTNSGQSGSVTSAQPPSTPAGSAVPPPGGTAPSTPTGTQPGVAGSPGAGGNTPAPAVQTPTPVVADNPEIARLRAELESERQAVARLQPYAQMGYKAFQQQGMQPKPADQPGPAAPKPIFNIPEFPENLKSFITYDANGNVTEKPGAPPGTAALYQQNLNAKAAALDSILRDPNQALSPVLEKFRAEAVEEAERRISEKVRDIQATQAEEQVFQANMPWMVAHDANNKPVINIDHLTGQQNYQFTPAGMEYARHYNALRQQKLSPFDADRYAQAHVRMMLSQQVQPAPAPVAPPPPPVDPKQSFIAGFPGATPGANQPQGQVVVPAEGAVAAKRMTAQQHFEQSFRAHGLIK